MRPGCLLRSRWVEAHQGVLIVGPTGVGKTYLACALATAAIRAGHSALYLRTPRALTGLQLPGSTAGCRGFSPPGQRLKSSFSMTSAFSLSPMRRPPIYSKWSRTGPVAVPPSSRANCQSLTGTRVWANRRSPTRSSIDSFTAHTG